MQGTGSRRAIYTVVGRGREQCTCIKSWIKENKQLFSFSKMAEISQKEF